MHKQEYWDMIEEERLVDAKYETQFGMCATDFQEIICYVGEHLIQTIQNLKGLQNKAESHEYEEHMRIFLLLSQWRDVLNDEQMPDRFWSKYPGGFTKNVNLQRYIARLVKYFEKEYEIYINLIADTRVHNEGTNPEYINRKNRAKAILASLYMSYPGISPNRDVVNDDEMKDFLKEIIESAKKK